jgi:hypothetical protein
MPTEILRPNGAGSLTELTPSGATYNWDCVDDSSPDDLSTFVYKINGGGGWPPYEDRYTLPDLSVITGNIVSVTVAFRARRYNTGSATESTTVCWSLLYTHGTWYVGTTRNPPFDNSWNTYSEVYYTNPYTLGTWTTSEVNDLVIGYRTYAGSGGYAPYYYLCNICTQIYVSVYGTQSANVSAELATVDFSPSVPSIVRGRNLSAPLIAIDGSVLIPAHSHGSNMSPAVVNVPAQGYEPTPKIFTEIFPPRVRIGEDYAQ